MKYKSMIKVDPASIGAEFLLFEVDDFEVITDEGEITKLTLFGDGFKDMIIIPGIDPVTQSAKMNVYIGKRFGADDDGPNFE